MDPTNKRLLMNEETELSLFGIKYNNDKSIQVKEF